MTRVWTHVGLLWFIDSTVGQTAQYVNSAPNRFIQGREPHPLDYTTVCNMENPWGPMMVQPGKLTFLVTQVFTSSLCRPHCLPSSPRLTDSDQSSRNLSHVSCDDGADCASDDHRKVEPAGPAASIGTLLYLQSTQDNTTSPDRPISSSTGTDNYTFVCLFACLLSWFARKQDCSLVCLFVFFALCLFLLACYASKLACLSVCLSVCLFICFLALLASWFVCLFVDCLLT